MADFNEIDEARRLLGLSETATLKEIKSAFRTRAHRHHPDKHGDAPERSDEVMKELNRAYRLLLDYCADYKYSFGKEDVARTYPDEEDWRKWRERWRM
jgi:DnaJ-class molecular chaperone